MDKKEIYFGLRQHFVEAASVGTNAQPPPPATEPGPASLRLSGPALLRKGGSVAALTLMNVALFAGGADAQTPAATPKPASASADGDATEMPEVLVRGQQENRDSFYRRTRAELPQYTEPLRDTPQSVTVVPRQIIEDQGATSLRDSLRNVSGISLAAGEGGSQGDNLTIRGFSARSDIFLDGMRDFGSYTRDPFNLEAVEVLKGPSSLAFGRGSTGGVVNQASKMPQPGQFVAGNLLFGTDATRRGTLDLNQPLPNLPGDLGGASLRLNLMGTAAHVAGRDVTEFNRYGVAPAITLGLGKPTRLTIQYFHEVEDDIPDYGHPFVLSRPTNIPRESFYGFKSDYLRTNVDVVTARLDHDFNENLSVREQFRYGNYDRDVRVTEPALIGTVTAATPREDIQIQRRVIAVESNETNLDNLLTVNAKVPTGPLHHSLVGGFEYIRETSDPTRFAYTGVPSTALVAPNDGEKFRGTATPTTQVETTLETVSLFAVDTIKLGEHWAVTGGLRYDHVNADYTQSLAPTAARFSRTDDVVSWRAGIVFKPLPNGSIYFSSGTSFNPSAEQLSLASSNINLEPEKNLTFELGTKWDLFNEKLSVYGALFRLEKTNARTPDPDNPLLNILGGNQRVDGFEVGLVGKITDDWQVLSGYTFLDSEVVESNTANQVGNPLQNTPQHTFVLWTTYNLPWKLQIGGGVNVVSRRNASLSPDANTNLIRRVGGYAIGNVMVKYNYSRKVNFQVNVTNVSDEFYYDGIHPAHIIPGPGRTALFSTNFNF